MLVRTLPDRLKLNRPMLHAGPGETKTLEPGKVTPGMILAAEQPEGGNRTPMSIGVPLKLPNRNDRLLSTKLGSTLSRSKNWSRLIVVLFITLRSTPNWYRSERDWECPVIRVRIGPSRVLSTL